MARGPSPKKTKQSVSLIKVVQTTRRQQIQTNPLALVQEYSKTLISVPILLFTLGSMTGMLIVAFLNWGTQWGFFAMLEAGFAAFIIPAYYINQHYAKDLPPPNQQIMVIQFVVLIGITAVLQFVAAVNATITTLQEFAYYLMAPFAENAFFVAFTCLILSGYTNNKARMILAIILPSITFMLAHSDYYGTWGIFFVAGLGIAQGFCLVYWKNYTLTVLVHFILNFIISLHFLYAIQVL